MGVVYRATDRDTGSPVALKLLAELRADLVERFAREVQALARLRHDRVVRYVAHGTDQGRVWLAMEWLDGEDLAARLARGPLTVDETLALARAAAAALAAAHAAGLVHRDVKPSNLFLPMGSAGSAKLLDFGLVRALETEHLTRAGHNLGTPVYMSPEQVLGDEVDARSDVFSLGSVLHECLVGRAPFAAAEELAVGLRIVCDEAPALATLRPDVPHGLASLVAEMLAKARESRPRDGAALLERIAALGEGQAPLRPSQAPRGITSAEQRLVAVVLARAPSLHTAPTLANDPTLDGDRTRTGVAAPPDRDPFARGRIYHLAGGLVLCVVESAGSAIDQAAHAAEGAFALLARSPGITAALAVGRARIDQAHPIGEALDRAVAVLRAAEAVGPGVHLDDVAAGLLDGRFALDRAAGVHRIASVRSRTDLDASAATPRSPFVGRERELGIVEGALRESIDEGVARAVLVIGAAGAGKSPLLREVLARLAASGAGVSVWRAAAAPFSTGTPFGMLRDLVRVSLGVRDGDTPERARAGLAVRSPDDGVRAFLAELLGVGDGSGTGDVLAARRDPALMRDRLRDAFVAWLRAACDAGPVALVLEDLHWGDAPSVAALDAALRELADRPLAVLAFARPELADGLGPPWRDRGVLSLQLSALPRKACERLVRAVCGDAVGAERLAGIVERAEGNPFFVEELARAAAGGEADAPGTVLAMLQARLEAMETPARRVLRAASTFGRVFHRKGVEAVLAGAEDAGWWLPELVRRDVLVAVPGSGGEEHRFRHALLRDAAYAMFVDDDRARAHRLAGAWLEERGGVAASVRARHHELGGQSAAARQSYAEAADQALGAGDFAAALDASGAAERCGASGAELGALRYIAAEARQWQGDYVAALRDAEEALQLLPRGGDAWWRAAELVAHGARNAQRWDRAAELGVDLLAAADDGLGASAVCALLGVARTLVYGARWAEGGAIMERVRPAAESIGRDDPFVLAHLRQEEGNLAYFAGSLDTSLRTYEEAARGYVSVGDRRRGLIAMQSVGFLHTLLGCDAESVRVLSENLAEAGRLGVAGMQGAARMNLCVPLARLGRFDEALAMAHAAIAALGANPRHLAFGRSYLATALLLRGGVGDLAEAEAEARGALDGMGRGNPSGRMHVLGVLAAVLVARGAFDEARTHAAEGMALLADIGRTEGGEGQLRRAHAESLAGCGDEAGAAAAWGAGRRRLEELAAKLADPALRSSFLAIADNAAILRRSVG